MNDVTAIRARSCCAEHLEHWGFFCLSEPDKLACGWRFASTPVARFGMSLAVISVNGTSVNFYQADSGLCLKNRIHGHFGVIGDVCGQGPIGSRKPNREATQI